MSEIKHAKIDELMSRHRCDHDAYEYYRKDFVPWGYAEKSMISVYEIPPLKSAYPYHYHHKNEETFYIISGEGMLKTPQGDRKVSAGELLFFPANSEGAHKLTNSSETEKLVYIDFDVIHDLDVTVYPNSNKIGVWGKGVNKVYKLKADTDYYDGE
jgi:uncharacterized cupin superfamily protein